ncbi:SpoIIE family protein phosphatase [Peterkaempfera sp. SMS 1(5)a]
MPWLAADPARAEAIRASGSHTLITAPLAVRGTVLGLISLYRTQQPDPYDEDDVKIVLQLADHTALCIDNARRYTREHTIAATVQRHLLPRRPASHTALETAYLPLSPDNGREWYDTIALSGARTALVVGGVTESGIYATALMGQLRTVIRSLSALDLEPEDLLARLNDIAAFLEGERAAMPSTASGPPTALYAACAYAVYDPLTRICTIVGAGSPALVLARPDGTTESLEVPSGPLLGSADGAPSAIASHRIPEGGLLILSAAPVPALQPPSDPPNGSPSVQRILSQAHRPLEDLCDDILYALSSRAPASAAALLARTHSFPPQCVAAWQLEDTPASVATARHHARRQLATWDVEEETALSTELIVSELVTNAVRHGSPPLELRLINDRTLTCEVRDTGLASPHLRHAHVVDEGGRGLFIIAQLAEAWGTRYTAEGKTIWTEQALPPPPG